MKDFERIFSRGSLPPRPVHARPGRKVCLLLMEKRFPGHVWAAAPPGASGRKDGGSPGRQGNPKQRLPSPDSPVKPLRPGSRGGLRRSSARSGGKASAAQAPGLQSGSFGCVPSSAKAQGSGTKTLTGTAIRGLARGQPVTWNVLLHFRFSGEMWHRFLVPCGSLLDHGFLLFSLSTCRHLK